MSFRLLSINTKINKHTCNFVRFCFVCVCVCVFVCVCEIRPLTLRVEQGRRVFENRALMVIFGSISEKETRDQKKSYN
jgi:hypothetical protein